MPFQDGDYLRAEYKGRALKFKGRTVKHHEDCEANMCNGRPFCRRLDETGGAWLIEQKKPRMKHKWNLFPPSQCVCLCHPSGDTKKDCSLCYEPSEKRRTK